MATPQINVTTVARAWLAAQPDLIECPLGARLTLRACKRRQSNQRVLVPDGTLEAHKRRLGAVGTNCRTVRCHLIGCQYFGRSIDDPLDNYPISGSTYLAKYLGVPYDVASRILRSPNGPTGGASVGVVKLTIGQVKRWLLAMGPKHSWRHIRQRWEEVNGTGT